MNGIIYKEFLLIILISLIACKKEKKIVIDEITIDQINSISILDTLNLGEYTKISENWREYENNKQELSSFLFDKIKLDKEKEDRFKKSPFNDAEYLSLIGKIELNGNNNTLLLRNPESVYIMYNYNYQGELVDFIEFSKYNQLMCQCVPTLYIDPSGVIHCYTETGYPYYSYVWYKVNDEGKFEITKEYMPPNQEEMSDTERLSYIIKKTPEFKDEKLSLDIGPNDPTFSKSTFLNEKEIETVLFSNNKKVFEVYKEHSSVYKSLYVYGKLKKGDELELIAYPQLMDNRCIIFTLNLEHEIIDIKYFDTEGSEPKEII